MGSPRLDGGGGVVKGVKDQARRAFQTVCTGLRQKRTWGRIFLFSDVTGSVGMTREVSG